MLHPLKNPRLSAAISALCLLSWSGDLAADDEPGADDDGDEITVRTVDTATSQRDDERFASAMTTRLDTRDLSFRAESLDHALMRVSGVYARRDSSFGQPAQLSVRGGNSRQMVVELDGLRLSAPAGVGFDAGQMMSDGIESVDVFRGSGAAIYGGGAVTGAMRLNPARSPDDGWELKGRTMVGSFGTTAMSVAAGTGEEKRGFRLHGAARQSSGDFDFVDDQGVEHRRINNDHRRFGFGGTGHIEEGTHRLRVTGMWEGGDAGSPGPSEFQRSLQDARVDDHRGLATFRWEGQQIWESSKSVVDAHLSAGAQQRSYRYNNQESPLTREPFESRATERSVAMTGGLAALIGSSHLARVDAEGRFETYDGALIAPREEQLQAFRRTAAISAADEWLLAGERLSLIAAVRAEASDDTNADTAQVEPFLPAAGAIARLHERLELRANLARTFRRPDFDELYLQTDGMRGNPDLLPERAWVADAGFRLGDSADPLVVEVAGFTHSIDSTILFLPVSAHLFEAQNLRGATSRGIEASARLKAHERWRLDTGYTLTRATLNRDSEVSPQLPGQPRHRVVVESKVDVTDWAFLSTLPGVELTSAFHYRSRVNLDNFGSLQNPRALRVDAGAVVDVTTRIRSGLILHNIFDHRRAQDSLHRPLPGRAIYMSMELRGQGS